MHLFPVDRPVSPPVVFKGMPTSYKPVYRFSPTPVHFEPSQPAWSLFEMTCRSPYYRMRPDRKRCNPSRSGERTGLGKQTRCKLCPLPPLTGSECSISIYRRFHCTLLLEGPFSPYYDQGVVRYCTAP